MECSSTSFYFCERQPLQHWAMMKPLQAGDSAHPQLLRSSLSAMSRTAKCQMLNHKRFDFEKFEGVPTTEPTATPYLTGLNLRSVPTSSRLNKPANAAGYHYFRIFFLN